MIGKYISKKVNKEGNIEVTIEFSELGSKQDVENLELDQNYKIDFKIKRRERSLSANAYCWVLCGLLAEYENLKKEEVYKKAITESGKFTIVPIQNNILFEFMDSWNNRGIGWMCEVFGKSQTEKNATEVIFYIGSSEYDTKEMSRLINSLVFDCRERGIPTLEDIEIQRMIDEWKCSSKDSL